MYTLIRPCVSLDSARSSMCTSCTNVHSGISELNYQLRLLDVDLIAINQILTDLKCCFPAPGLESAACNCFCTSVATLATKKY